MTVHTYILLSEKINKFFIGSTGNLEDRMARHDNGRSKATAIGIPWKLMHIEDFEIRGQAYQREMEIKSCKSHDLVTQLVSTSHFRRVSLGFEFSCPID